MKVSKIMSCKAPLMCTQQCIDSSCSEMLSLSNDRESVFAFRLARILSVMVDCCKQKNDSLLETTHSSMVEQLIASERNAEFNAKVDEAVAAFMVGSKITVYFPKS